MSVINCVSLVNSTNESASGPTKTCTFLGSKPNNKPLLSNPVNTVWWSVAVNSCTPGTVPFSNSIIPSVTDTLPSALSPYVPSLTNTNSSPEV